MARPSSPSSVLRSRWLRVALIAAAAVLLVVAPLVLPPIANLTLVRIGVYAVAILGLNIVMGYTGQVNLGQIFFVGLGAYMTAYGVRQEWNILVVFAAACVVAGVAGLLLALAAARLGGLAIAMVTIALPIVGVPLAKRLDEFTGGSQGISARFTDAPEWSGLFTDQWQYYVILLVTVPAFLLARQLVRGKYGRAFAVVRENEAVAASMGVSPYRTKVLAFTVASVYGGASGFLYMAAVQYTSPETLSFGHSIALLAAMVIGGAGSIAGSLIGGVYYVFVPQLTNAIDPSYTALSQGLILLAVLFLLPEGLVSLPRAVRRLARGKPPHPSSSDAASEAPAPGGAGPGPAARDAAPSGTAPPPTAPPDTTPSATTTTPASRERQDRS